MIITVTKVLLKRRNYLAPKKRIFNKAPLSTMKEATEHLKTIAWRASHPPMLEFSPSSKWTNNRIKVTLSCFEIFLKFYLGKKKYSFSNRTIFTCNELNLYRKEREKKQMLRLGHEDKTNNYLCTKFNACRKHSL